MYVSNAPEIIITVKEKKEKTEEFIKEKTKALIRCRSFKTKNETSLG